MDERRKHRRVPLGGRALVDAGDGPTGGRCKDVSTGGLGVEGDFALRRGSVVWVAFDVPGNGVVETTAEIVRVSAGECALRFLRLTPPSLRALLSYVAV